jgi:hypothetical protein
VLTGFRLDDKECDEWPAAVETMAWQASDDTELPNELRDTGTIEAILKNDSGIAQNYRHAPKRVMPGESIEAKGAVLK